MRRLITGLKIMFLEKTLRYHTIPASMATFGANQYSMVPPTWGCGIMGMGLVRAWSLQYKGPPPKRLK